MSYNILELEKLNKRDKIKRQLYIISFVLIMVWTLLPESFYSAFAVTYSSPTAKLQPIDNSSAYTNDPNLVASGKILASNWYTQAATGVGDTKTNPYVISNGMQLAYLATLVNSGNNFTGKYISLVGSGTGNCIDLISNGILFYMTSDTAISYYSCDTDGNGKGWNPIGDSEANSFNGTIFAGTSDTDTINIYNLSGICSTQSAYGLFGFLGDNASVNGINMLDTQIFVGPDATVEKGGSGAITYTDGTASVGSGAIAGTCYENTSVKNCSVKGLNSGLRSISGSVDYYVPSFTIRTDYYTENVGGIIGNILSKSSSTQNPIYNCDFYGTLVGHGTAGTGGIVGLITGMKTIDNCDISGISSTNPMTYTGAGTDVGGIVGKISGSAAVIIQNVAQNSNESYKVIGDDTYMNGGFGGILGKSISTSPVTIQNIGTSTYKINVEMNGRFYTTNTKTDVNSGFAGIIGYSSGTSTTITDCYVTSKIKYGSVSGKNNAYIGGVLGRGIFVHNTTDVLNISNCNVLDGSYITHSDDYTTSNSSAALTQGGIVGAINVGTSNGLNLTNSSITNCTVTNMTIETDGYAGGIIGLGYSSDSCGIMTISGCKVNGLTLNQQNPNTTTSTQYLLSGGITPIMIASTISDCTVENFTVNYNVKYVTSSMQTLVGGIAAICKGSTAADATISNCISNAVFNIGSIGNNRNPVYVGGIVGNTSNATSKAININKCISVIDFNPVGLTTDGNVIVGGIIGETYVTSKTPTVNITNCISSGDINVSYPNPTTTQSSVGGIVGIIDNLATCTVSNNVSTVSIDGNLQDCLGGLIGFNNSTNSTISNNHFGGSMLGSDSASIAQYSVGGTYTGNTYDSIMSPNSPSCDGYFTAGMTSAFPLLTSMISSPTLKQIAYYNAMTSSIVALPAGTNNVKTLYGSATVNGNSVTGGIFSVTDANNIVTRRLKLVQGMSSHTEDGVTTSFLIANSSDLIAMQTYVAGGGGFLGAKFKLAADITSSITNPIGTASSDEKTSDYGLPFCGNFDGNNKTITLTGSRSTDVNYNGLFGYIKSASILNLKVYYNNANTININSTVASGGIAGIAKYSTCSNVNVTTSQNGIASDSGKTGGLIGYAESTKINTSAGEISSFTGKLIGNSYVGGIAGQYDSLSPTFVFSTYRTFISAAVLKLSDNADTVTLEKCYVTGDVIGGALTTGTSSSNSASNIGGLIGYLSVGATSITNSFMFGNVTGGTYVGGIIGQIDTLSSSYNSQINKCYLNGAVYANGNAGGIVGYVGNCDKTQILALNSYFVGQIQCGGTIGALSSVNASYTNFFFDKQVAGDIDTCGGVKGNSVSGLSTSGLMATTISGFINTTDSVPDTSIKASSNDVGKTSITSSNSFGSILFGNALINSQSGSNSDGAQSLTDKWYEYTAQTRYLLKNSSTLGLKTSNSAVFSFKGTYFTLNDWLSSNSDAFLVKVDGISVYFAGQTSSTSFATGLYWYEKDLLDAGSNVIGHVKGVLNSTSGSSLYTCSPVIGTNTVANTLFITNLSYATHTIEIIPYCTKSTSFLTFQGCTFGGSSPVITNYPQISTMSSLGMSNKSTLRLYDFTTDSKKNSHDFLQNYSITETANIANVTYTHSPTPITGVSYSSGIYTRTDSGTSNSFTITGDYGMLNGYNLKISEKIIMTPFALGSGKETDPYQIRNVQELVSFKNYINNIYSGAGQYFKLTMDSTTPSHSPDGITYDLSDTSQNPDGNWNVPIGISTSNFQGNFDGNGRQINNINITKIADNDNVSGFFGHISGCSIKNLKVNGTIDASSVNQDGTTGALKTNGKDSYVGLLAGDANSSNIHNITADYNITMRILHSSPTTEPNMFKIGCGGAVGQISGTSSITNVLGTGTLNGISSKTQTRPIQFGGIIGWVNHKDINSTIEIDNCISDASINTSTTANTYMQSNNGGIIGNVTGNLSSNTNVVNCASYGTFNTLSGNTGGILGGCTTTYTNYVLSLNSCVSTANIESGSTTITASTDYVGGIIGNNANGSNQPTLNNCTFGGEINYVWSNGTSKRYIGGIIGYSAKNVDTSSSNNYYDTTKNYGISSVGNELVTTSVALPSATNGSKTSAELINSTTGMYSFPDIETDNGITFGNANNKIKAEKIILGNSIAFNVVRTDNTALSTEQLPLMDVSSLYVLPTSGATLSESGDSSKVYTINTISGRRIVSTTTERIAPITAQIVKMVSDGNGGQVDILSGYGKIITYYPSTTSTGRSDASYIMADPAGDGIESGNLSAAHSYTIYTADSLMGLDTLVNGNATDGYGGRADTDVSAENYKINLGQNIIFGASTATDYTNSVIGSDTKPFTGILEGSAKENGTTTYKEHTISGIMQKSTGVSTGLFAKLSNATIRNTGITESSFVGSGSTYSGSVGSFAAKTANTTFTNCISDARVEQGNTNPSGVFIGGFTGNSTDTVFSNCAFTGSLGATAISGDNPSYPSIVGTGEYFAGGFTGMSSGTLAISNGSYIASYIDGDINDDKSHDMGQFVGKNNNGTVTTPDSYIDYKAGSNCKVVGNGANIVESVAITDNLYPAIWINNADDVITARIAATFTTSADSLSKAELFYSHTDGTTKIAAFSNADYYGTKTVSSSYSIDPSTVLTRTNTGDSTALITYGTSSRVIEMSLQCWYDNYTINTSGQKVYTLKSAADLFELKELIEIGDIESTIGHTHLPHTGTGIASDDFEGAIIKLGANITIEPDQTLAMIGNATDYFKGTFDGNGYAIINANFISDSTGRVGLFGYIPETTTIENLIFSGNTSITIPDTIGGDVYASLVCAVNDGTITNCANGSIVKITNNSSTANVIFGAIAGRNNAGKTVSECYNMQLIKANNEGMNISGIVGKNSGTVSCCYNTGMLQGYMDSTVSDYKCHTVMAGISAINVGTVTCCYNAAALKNFDESNYNPIANGGTIEKSYMDGEIFKSGYSYVSSYNGNIYSAGVTIKSTESLSAGALPTDFNSNIWTATQGYYPQPKYFTESGLSNDVTASKVSTLATKLSSNNDEGTFDYFTKIAINYGIGTNVMISEDAGNVGTFTKTSTSGGVTMAVNKKGLAYVTFSLESDDLTFSRLTYFLNEELYTIRYMFDFSQLTNNNDESSQRVLGAYSDINYGSSNTFANSESRIGKGTANDPYLINTADDLLAMSTFVNEGSTASSGRTYKMINNIDMTGYTYVPIGTEVHPFNGVFNGCGYIISGITYNDSSSDISYAGLFGKADNSSTIELLGLVDCTFSSNTNSGSTKIGAIVGYSNGLISNCYSKSVVRALNTSNTLAAGGLVGELGVEGSLTSCYARPNNQGTTGSVIEGTNPLCSYVQEGNNEYYGGILVGINRGNINACYHTGVYYLPISSGITYAKYGILVGWYATGEITNTYYDKTLIDESSHYLYVKVATTKVDGETARIDNNYGCATTKMKTTEAAASTNGIANDSMALILSKDSYLGTYEMSQLPYAGTYAGNRYSNDGYPMLTGFDLNQFKFASLNASNIILNLQNSDSSEAKLMNALCSYSNYDFPIYADIKAKTKLIVNTLAFSRAISYNVSVVAYGRDDATGDELKWTSLDGYYSVANGLDQDIYAADETTVLSKAHGDGMISNLTNYGTTTIVMSGKDLLPTNCNKIYIYLSLKKSLVSNSTWGVYHNWDSSELNELIQDNEAD